MRHSITTRLILAFLVVSITVVALASAITYWLTVIQFKQLVFDQSRDRFVADVGLYYQMHGNWNGVLDYVNLRNPASQTGGPGHGSDQGPFGPSSGQGQPNAITFVLADAGGKVIVPAGTTQAGQSLSAAALAGGTPVNVNSQRVGTVLVVGSVPPLGPLETSYLQRSNMALLYAALGAAGLALALGIILARSLTHPLHQLTAAIQAMNQGDLKQHVEVHARDEIGELAAAFNRMSADLDRANRLRKQMTADIAHDLRSPLTVIGGYVEAMRDGVLNPSAERLEAIHAEVQHLQRLVEDLRTLSQADAGELVLNRQALAPSALLERMAQAYTHLAATNGITLAVEYPPNLPELRLDPDRMAQVFGNLISNSLRYTPAAGTISLAARREGNTLLFQVTDTGSGIPAEALPHIFDRFYRADPARSEGNESGLGLAIAKSIVEAHGGSIVAGSETNKGTTMTITFPLS